MANKVDHRGRNKTSRFVKLDHFMLRHSSWRKLSPHAVAIYIQICAIYNGRNNGQITFSYRQAAEQIGCSKSSASRAFKELVDCGFLAVEKLGNWYGRQATEWRLTTYRCNERMPTNDWQKLR